MTYYGGKEMAAAFRTVRNNTVTIAEEIPENQYGFQPATPCRTIGQTLVHIALGPSFQYEFQTKKLNDLAAFKFTELMQKIGAEEAKPRSKAEIISFLRTEGEKFASFLEGLPESFLSEQVKMPPGAQPASKTRFEMLLSPK